MRFMLIDRITRLEPGQRITAIKNLSLAEEYLADHFPHFPVLPGVLMLEAMTQAGAWLIRATEDFAHSIVVLKEARNVKYANFVAPGEMLTIEAKILDHDERYTGLKIEGKTEGKINVSGRLILERYNLADTNPGNAHVDRSVVRSLRQIYGIIYDDKQPIEQSNGIAEKH